MSQEEYNLTYDNNGNLIQGFNKYFEYNNFNQLILVREINQTGRILEKYYYSPEGDRIKKIEFNQNISNSTIYYLGKNFIQIINNSGTFNSTYYYDDEALVAEKDWNNKLYFYHSDHLGSTNLITNGSGQVIEETFYMPYGEIIQGGKSRYLFTGKEKDTMTGLYYYGARYYDASFKHFIQPDYNIKNIYNK